MDDFAVVVRDEIRELRREMREEFRGFRSEMQSEFGRVRGEIGEVRGEAGFHRRLLMSVWVTMLLGFAGLIVEAGLR